MKVTRSGRQIYWAAAALIVLLIVAYGNSFTAPFIFDDTINIMENSSIQKLWPLWHPFNVPADTGLTGRPLVNFSLAINYAVSKGNTWSYHALNLIIHILATLTFLGIIRLTIMTTEKGARYLNIALPFSFACALLWGLHPMHTQAVTYIIQRCESLMGLFFLLTFYAAIRGRQSESSSRWHLLSIMFFLLAISSKEVAVVCPVLLLIYEWVFEGHHPWHAIRQSPLLYAGLVLGLIVATIMAAKGNTLISRTETIPFTPVSYWITQCQVIFHYLRLVVWPSGLTIDYGWPMAPMREAWPSMLGVLIALGLSVWALRLRNAAGFLGLWFFMILAPTSLIPLPDPAFEQRMYLPSAAIIILIVGAAVNTYEWSQKQLKLWPGSRIYIPAGAIALVICAGLIFAFLTYQRNFDYRSDVAIWSDTIKKRPNNFRGYHGLGLALSNRGRQEEALKCLHHALILNPHNSYANNDAGFILLLMNRPHEAIPFFQKAIQIKDKNSKAYNNLGAALAQTGNLKEAIFHFTQALRIKPESISVRDNLIKAVAAYEQSASEHHDN
jgi:hypothetical protein